MREALGAEGVAIVGVTCGDRIGGAFPLPTPGWWVESILVPTSLCLGIHSQLFNVFPIPMTLFTFS